MTVVIKARFLRRHGRSCFRQSRCKCNFLPESCLPIWFLTREGLEELSILHPEIFGNLTVDKIDEKNKAGGFGKGLVLLEWSRNILNFDIHLSFLNIRREAENIERQLVVILHMGENKSLSRLVFKAIPIYVLFC
jgi:hypothetical protein